MALMNRSVNRLKTKITAMSDNPSKKVPQDANRVNVNQAHEVKYWRAKFGCTEAELRAAVKAVGTSVAAVRKYLGK